MEKYILKSEIGYTVFVLTRKNWGKILIDRRLRSQQWWKNHLQELINKKEEPISIENLWDSKPIEPIPIPFEIEFNMPNLNSDVFLESYKRINEKKRNSL